MLLNRSNKRGQSVRLEVEWLEDRTTPSSATLGFALALGSAGYDWGRAVVADTEGNVYATGHFNGTVDFDPGASTVNLTSAGSDDIYVLKLNSGGSLVWARQLGGSGSDEGNGVAIDASGNVYITGDFRGTADFDPGPDTFNLTSTGLDDLFVSKLDNDGNFVWARAMGGSSAEVGAKIAVDGEGSVYTLANFEGTVDFDPGAGIVSFTSAGSVDICVSKFDSAGNLVWARRLGGSLFDEGHSIVADFAGNVYATGFVQQTVDFDPGASTFNLSGAGNSDTFVWKLDSAGSFVWAGLLSGSGADGGNSIAVDADQNVYTTGYFQGTVDFDPGPNNFNLSSTGFDSFVSKLDGAGGFVWAFALGSSANEYGFGITVDATGNVIATGTFWTTVDFDPSAGVFNLSAGEDDVYVCKFSSLGEFSWACALGGTKADISAGIAVNNASNIFITGSFAGTSDFDPGPDNRNFTFAGNTDSFIVGLIDNRSPQADTGGPYSINEGNAVALNAGGSSDPDDDPLTFSWDLNGDDVFDDAMGVNASVSWATLKALGLDDGHAEHAIRVRVTDTANQSGTSTATLVIHNAPPTVTAANNSVAVNEGTPAINSGTFQDPGDDSVTVTASVGTITQDDEAGTWSWTLPTSSPSQSQTVTITATDSDGDSSSLTFSVAVNNQPPTADADGPYTIAEGAGVTLDGSGSTDPDDSLIYSWDVNGDNIFGDAHGVNPSLTWAQLQALGIDDGPGEFAVRVRVDDGNGHIVDSLATTLIVSNAVPLPSIAGPANGVRGQPRSFVFSATDQSPVDQAAGFQFSILWGDGTAAQTVAATPGNGAGVALKHVFTGTGTFFVRATVTDKDGAHAVVIHAINIVAVALQADPVNPSKTSLAIGGSVGNDNILVLPANVAGLLSVTINGVPQGRFTPTGTILLFAQDGNDRIELRSRMLRGRTTMVTRPAIVYGDAGNDHLDAGGSAARNILLGGNGNDTVLGGANRDLLIGGPGRDSLQGRGGQDILIGGTTAHDTDLGALIALMAEWGRRDANFDMRIRHLTGSLVGGVNTPYFLNRATVQDDGQLDVFDGGADRNWLLP